MKPYILLVIPDGLWFQNRATIAPLNWKDYRKGPVFYRVACILTASILTDAHAVDEERVLRLLGGLQDDRILIHQCDDPVSAAKMFGLLAEGPEVGPE
jgi:hypothetical protein